MSSVPFFARVVLDLGGRGLLEESLLLWQPSLDYFLFLSRVRPNPFLTLGWFVRGSNRLRGWGFGSSHHISLILTQVNTPGDNSHTEVRLVLQENNINPII
jgi:hypothetical protein